MIVRGGRCAAKRRFDFIVLYFGRSKTEWHRLNFSISVGKTMPRIDHIYRLIYISNEHENTKTHFRNGTCQSIAYTHQLKLFPIFSFYSLHEFFIFRKSDSPARFAIKVKKVSTDH